MSKVTSIFSSLKPTPPVSPTKAGVVLRWGVAHRNSGSRAHYVALFQGDSAPIRIYADDTQVQDEMALVQAGDRVELTGSDSQVSIVVTSIRNVTLAELTSPERA